MTILDPDLDQDNNLDVDQDQDADFDVDQDKDVGLCPYIYQDLGMDQIKIMNFSLWCKSIC